MRLVFEQEKEKVFITVVIQIQLGEENESFKQDHKISVKNQVHGSPIPRGSS